MGTGVFDFVPTWGVYIVVTLSILLSFEAGYQISKYTALHNDKEGSSATSPMVGGLLGMLAFVLAFTFSMAASQHNLRKQNILKEANAIGTAYLRADLVDDPYKTNMKHLLKEYVDIRLNAVKNGMDTDLIKSAIVRSVEIHDLLWTEVSTIAKEKPSPNTGLLVQSINNVIDMHEKRINEAFSNRIPGSIWLTLFVISSLTMMTMGAQAGLSKARRLVAVVPLIMAFSALTTVVVDLDRPLEGMITVGQESMSALQRSMEK